MLPEPGGVGSSEKLLVIGTLLGSLPLQPEDLLVLFQGMHSDIETCNPMDNCGLGV